MTADLVRYVVEGRQATREEFNRHQAATMLLYGNAYSCSSRQPEGTLVVRSLSPADVQEGDPGRWPRKAAELMGIRRLEATDEARRGRNES